MSYDESEAAWDELYDQFTRELYPEHKKQAIEEFTSGRLRSYYEANPAVMRPAIDAIQEGRWQQSHERSSASLVFFVTAVELLFKATLLRPVLYGLIHSEGVAEVMVKYTLSQTGFDRYESLLATLFSELAGIDIGTVSREGEQKKLLKECQELQSIRNRVIHQGMSCSPGEAERARLVAVAVFELVVSPMLGSLGLTVREKGVIAAG